MLLYHATDRDFRGEMFDIAQCHSISDFGKRLYFSFDELSAYDFSNGRWVIEVEIDNAYLTKQTYNGIRTYRFETDISRISTEERIVFARAIVENRKGDTSFLDEYDIVVGPRADARAQNIVVEYCRHNSDWFSNETLLDLFEELTVERYTPQVAFNSKAIHALLWDPDRYHWYQR